VLSQVERAAVPEASAGPAKGFLRNRSQQDIAILLVGALLIYLLCGKIPKYGDDIKTFIEYFVFVDLCIKYFRNPPSE
jgi:hypothetical protein